MDPHISGHAGWWSIIQLFFPDQVLFRFFVAPSSASAALSKTVEEKNKEETLVHLTSLTKVPNSSVFCQFC